MSFYENKRILIVGSCGTIGVELLRQLIESEKNIDIVGIDNNENAIFFQNEKYRNLDNVQSFVCDIRELDDLTAKTRGIDIVFHTAALKHVNSCEFSPEQAVKTNILGVQNIISAAWENGVDRVLFTSSDKAVNPTNVMGTSKLMGERLITAANNRGLNSKGPIFSSTRFGNVLGSNGSVLPIFKNQIAAGEDLTLTHRDMSRFVMTAEQAVSLVLDTAVKAQGGEVFITKMPVINIVDLAEVMIDIFSNASKSQNKTKIVEIGSKPGEKLYEELLSLEEMARSIELEEYFVVLPAFRDLYSNKSYTYPDKIADRVTDPYISSEQVGMNHEQIKSFLLDNKLI